MAAPAKPKILTIFPPGYKAIRDRFNLMGRRVIFAHAPYIYNPHKITVGPELIAHESIHIERQGTDPAGWWRRYCEDVGFRLAEEVPAHVAEWRVLGEGKLGYVAERLAAPLYGFDITVGQAAALLSSEDFKRWNGSTT